MTKRLEAKELITIGFGILVLGVAIVLGKALDLLDLRTVLLGTILIAIIILLEFSIVQVLWRAKHEMESEKLLAKLRELIPPREFNWLFSDADLAEIEAKTKGKNVWIVSPDLSHDTLKGVFIDAVKKNLKRGITYTYIVPDTKQISGLIPALRQIFSAHSRQLVIRPIEKDIFETITVTHIVIHNPYMEGNHPAGVFFELPIASRRYWVEVDQHAALGFIGRFSRYVEAETPSQP